MPSDRYWRDDELALLEGCDFFSGTQEDFAASAQSSSCLWQGAHRQPTPFVSIVITTYKRPQWLKIALDSALAQEGFDDFEVVVVDNECAENLQETETSALMCTYHDEKIVYYRNRVSARSRTNAAVACAKSPYICVLHDDDFLSPYHLRVMVGVLKAYPEISYLACGHRSFSSRCYEEARVACVLSSPSRPTLRRYTCASVSIGCYPGWLGALIRKENFVNIGGMVGNLSIDTGVGDAIMIARYMDRYSGAVLCGLESPLYYYRISKRQDSALGGVHWANSYVVVLFLYKYINKKYHSRFLFFWNILSEIRISKDINNRCRQYNNVNKNNFSAFRRMSRTVNHGENVFYFFALRVVIKILCCYYRGGAMSAFRNSIRALLRRWCRLTGLASKNVPSGE